MFVMSKKLTVRHEKMERKSNYGYFLSRHLVKGNKLMTLWYHAMTNDELAIDWNPPGP